MCENSVLKERIDNNEKQNSKEHAMVIDKLETVETSFNKLLVSLGEKTTIYDERYVLRRDFRMVVGIIGGIITVLSFIFGIVR